MVKILGCGPPTRRCQQESGQRRERSRFKTGSTNKGLEVGGEGRRVGGGKAVRYGTCDNMYCIVTAGKVVTPTAKRDDIRLHEHAAESVCIGLDDKFVSITSTSSCCGMVICASKHKTLAP